MEMTTEGSRRMKLTRNIPGKRKHLLFRPMDGKGGKRTCHSLGKTKTR